MTDSKHLLIVESPSKAKTLKKYLGPHFEVLASYGHVRDLMPKSGAVDTADHFAMKYQLIERNKKHVDAICQAVKSADKILLATDPDREGEAIAWHLAEILKEKNLIGNKTIERVAFHEITQQAILDAVAHPRALSLDLINAQQARRALDYLVGFNLSPLLWKKIRRGLSAGRVQSPALRLIVERESAIRAFEQQEYWSIHLESQKEQQTFQAKLTQLNGEKIQNSSIPDEARQQAILSSLEGLTTRVIQVEKKQRLRFPAAPFTTSTLQQEAVRKLGFSTDRAMKVAQQLYEGIDIGNGAVGLISYMRTDSVQLSQEALADTRSHIQAHFSAEFLPEKPLSYANKSKNAQEAHEAIRPTSIARTPENLRSHLTQDQFRLYEMIWKRTVACQMNPARFDTVSADLQTGEHAIFRATGQTLLFAGFMAVYREDTDDNTAQAAEDDEHRLPPLREGDTLIPSRFWGEQHFTQPPPRFTEASLVKTLEEFGIGRPSTYASIISTLMQREYVALDKKRFTPTDVGEVVNRFLTEHFSRYVDYEFTAKLEDQLDQISQGEVEWLGVLEQFWTDFSTQLTDKSNVSRAEVTQELLDEACPKCGKPLTVRLGKRGKFVGCSGFPECDFTRNRDGTTSTEEPVVITLEPDSQMPILLLQGPYGPYVQLGDGTTPTEGKKPKRVSLPKDVTPAQLTPEMALQLIRLPLTLGPHPETAKPVVVNIGRFGPYVQHDGNFRSIPKGMSLFTLELAQGLTLLAEPKQAARKNAQSGLIKKLGEHPKDNQPLELHRGQYGIYIKYGKINATVPTDMNVDEITLDDAVDLIALKLANAPDKPEKEPVNGNTMQRTAHRRDGPPKGKRDQPPKRSGQAPSTKTGAPRSKNRPRKDSSP